MVLFPSLETLNTGIGGASGVRPGEGVGIDSKSDHERDTADVEDVDSRVDNEPTDDKTANTAENQHLRSHIHDSANVPSGEHDVQGDACEEHGQQRVQADGSAHERVVDEDVDALVFQYLKSVSGRVQVRLTIHC
ncbi:hypothetical protein PMKS-002265 [Pichia membranifaciens]|uniref:Uncharacterized protein n=1 Tax=Pichia membranifaciens TaxID=4926 RepID=A0A1Q2YGW7_9ASCO|nr:hypothetical protein PMKS-002265 [Pichia membranifaciens]